MFKICNITVIITILNIQPSKHSSFLCSSALGSLFSGLSLLLYLLSKKQVAGIYTYRTLVEA